VQCSASANSKTFWKEATQFPDADAIAGLVLALSQLKDLGLGSRLEIRAGSTTPWVVAFTSWILGAFPPIHFENGLLPLGFPQNSGPTVIAVEEFNMGLEMMFCTDLGRPSDLIKGGASYDRWSGMVSVNTYGQSLRDEFDMGSFDATICLVDILPCALRQSLTLLRPSKDIRSLSQPDYNYSRFHENPSSLSASPFGQDANISKAMSLILGFPTELPPIDLRHDIPFYSLPALQKYLTALKETCKCARCQQEMSENHEQCRADIFWRGVVP
jgi:hypothetical protein